MKARTMEPPAAAAQLVRRLGLFDATMIVMGGIVGPGIFINSYVVARQVRTPSSVLDGDKEIGLRRGAGNRRHHHRVAVRQPGRYGDVELI